MSLHNMLCFLPPKLSYDGERQPLIATNIRVSIRMCKVEAAGARIVFQNFPQQWKKILFPAVPPRFELATFFFSKTDSSLSLSSSIPVVSLGCG